MSRLTGAETYGLMEAYQAVYAPQELTEDQVWEEVENWVNSLQEEGYDLSDYTWEEMYESYLVEYGAGPAGYKPPTSSGPRFAPTPSAKPSAPKTDVGAYVAYKAGGGDTKMRQNPGMTRDQIISQGNKNIFTPTPSAKPSGTPPLSGRFKDGKIVMDRRPAPAAATPTARPAAPAPTARPAAAPAPSAKPPATPAKPAAPATGMLGKTSFERRLPTSAELRAAQAARAGGEKDPEKLLQAAKLGGQQAKADAIVKSGAVAALKPAGTATPRNGFGVDARKLAAQSSVNSSFDLFDVVLGHLLDEGYADTEEAALAIMSNMSEEWRESIVEGAPGVYVPSRVDIFNKRQQDLRNRGQDVGPNIPGPSGGGQYPEPGAGKPGVLKLARGSSSSNRGVESKNNA